VGSLLHLQDAHERAQMLMPWKVNGTLEEAEAALLEAHLAECAECRADFAAETDLRARIASMPHRQEPGELPTLPRLRPPTGAARAVLARVLGRRVPLGWALAGPAAAAAAVALFLAMPQTSPAADPDYRLLGADERGSAGNVIVLFDPESTEHELREALEQVGGRLADGPTASGAYVIRVLAADRPAALERLRGLDQVMLAEPIDPAGGP